MSETSQQIEAVSFKPTLGGFIYRAPNPWIFGRADHYLVNAAQKAEILRILVPRRPLRRLAVIIAGALLWAAAMATVGWAFSGHEDPTVGDVAIMIVATFAALFLALHLAVRHRLRQMQSILAGAARTNATITPDEIRGAIKTTTSFRSAVTVGALSVFASVAQAFSLAIRSWHHPLPADVQSGLSAFLTVMFAFLAAWYFRIAIGKLRQNRSGA